MPGRCLAGDAAAAAAERVVADAVTGCLDSLAEEVQEAAWAIRASG